MDIMKCYFLQQKVDMAAAFLPVLVRYNKMVTYSNDLDEGVWMMMLKRPKESAAGSGLLAPFATYVWYVRRDTSK